MALWNIQWVNAAGSAEPAGSQFHAVGHAYTEHWRSRLAIVDPQTCRIVHLLQDDQQIPFAVSPRHTELAHGVGNQLYLRRADGSVIRRWHAAVPLGAIAFSEDGNRTAAFDDDQKLLVFDGSTDSGIAQPWTRRSRSDLAYSPTTDLLAYVSETVIEVVDLESNSQVARLSGHTAGIRDMEFAPDGSCLASASSDRTVRLWDYRSGAEVGRLNSHRGPVTCVRFAADGRTIVTSDADSLYFWDAATRQLFFTHCLSHDETDTDIEIESFAVSPDSSVIAITFKNPRETRFMHLADAAVGANSERQSRGEFGNGLRMTADVNGDDRADIVGFGRNGTWVSLSTGDSFAPARRWTNDFGNSMGWQADRNPRTMADVNGDGLDDVVGFGDDGVAVALSTGSRFAPSRRLNEFGYDAGWLADKHPRLMADVNGDGRADVIGFGDRGVAVALSHGEQFAASSIWSDTYTAPEWLVESHPRMLADVNGDGKDDVVGFGTRGVLVSLSTGTRFSDRQYWTRTFGSGSGYRVDSHPRLLADVNGDRMKDIIAFGEHEVAVSLSTGSRFAQPESGRLDFTYNRAWRVDRHPRLMGDVNGDGRADVVAFSGVAVEVALSTGSTCALSDSHRFRGYGRGSGWHVDRHPRMLADVNGDGRSDIVAFDEFGVWVSLALEERFAAPELWSPDFRS